MAVRRRTAESSPAGRRERPLKIAWQPPIGYARTKTMGPASGAEANPRTHSRWSGTEDDLPLLQSSPSSSASDGCPEESLPYAACKGARTDVFFLRRHCDIATRERYCTVECHVDMSCVS